MNTSAASTAQQESSETTQLRTMTSRLKGVTLYVKQSDVPNEELLSLYILAKEAAELKKAVNALIYERLKSGETIENLALSAPTSTRNIDDVCSAYSALKETLTTQDVMNCCSVKVSELEETFIRKFRTTDGKAVTRDEGERLLLEYLEEIITFKSTKEKVLFNPAA